MLTAPMPVLPSPSTTYIPSTSLPPGKNNAPPVSSQDVSLPVWMIYFMFGLLAVVALALFVVLAIVLRIKRF
jgi:hypothetical protein